MRNRDYASWDLGQMHMGRSGQGVGTVPVSCRYTGDSMGEGDYASWDLGQMHMGRSGQGVGTVPSSLNSSSQADPKFQKDYKAKYKKMKAKLALLEASPSSS
nr:hypothetical protein [Tanacetum cinerariifolium]